MLYRGEIVRLPHGCGNGVVIEETNGCVLVYVGQRLAHRFAPPVRRPEIVPIIEEYVECELVPTGRQVPLLAQWAARWLERRDDRRYADVG